MKRNYLKYDQIPKNCQWADEPFTDVPISSCDSSDGLLGRQRETSDSRAVIANKGAGQIGQDVRCWKSQVSETVSNRAVASSPLALRLPRGRLCAKHAGAWRPLRAVIGGLDAFVFEETE